MYKPIKDFETLYVIYDDGKVWSIKRNKYINQEIMNTGYARVSLYKNKKIYHKSVHRLVAEAFLPNLEISAYAVITKIIITSIIFTPLSILLLY